MRTSIFYFLILLSCVSFAQREEVITINQFSLDLFERFEKKNSEDNFVFSGLSVYSALTLCYLGADEALKKDIEKVLYQNKSVSISELSQLLYFLQDKNHPHSFVKIANRFWYDRKMVVDSNYSVNAEKYFELAPKALDFSRVQSTTDSINDWVFYNSNEMISDFVNPQLIANSNSLLVNTIAFEKKWLLPFSETKRDEFYTSSSEISETDFVRGEVICSRLNHYDGFEVVSLPYKNFEQVMLVFLPDETHSLSAIRNQVFDQTVLNEAVALSSMFHASSEYIMLPKFKHALDFDLTRDLISMGIENLIKPNSLSGIYAGGQIGMIKQKVVLEVDEQGSKASSATAVALTRGGAPNYLKINRPFYYFIVDKESHAILFSGQYVKP